jgi:cell division protein FtsI/penicillin-binding protein 2
VFEHARRRLGLIAILLFALAALLVARLVVLQVVRGASYETSGREGRKAQLRLPDSPRGCIRDRNGFLLAGNRPLYAIEAYPAYIPEPDVTEVVDQLAPLLQIARAYLHVILSGEEEWVILEPEATPQLAQLVDQVHAGGIGTQLWWGRVYPAGELTALVLGFVGKGGEEGFYGIEGFYEGKLSPTRVSWEGEVDAQTRDPLPFEEGTIEPPLPGVDLDLTLDLAVQELAGQELARALDEFRAESGTVIVMDPRTGAILAMVSFPSYDPDRYDEYAERNERLFVNPAVGSQYEPGSVFKIVTMAAALDSGTVTPETTYADEGQIEHGGEVTYNWDRRAYGEQDMSGILIHSLNVGAVWLSVRMGPDVFYRYVHAFGIGSLTGVDIQEEVAGELRVPGDLDWHDSDLAANAYGQALAVTPIQMISAVAAVANDGRLMRPHFVSRQVAPDGAVRTRHPVVLGQPISPEVAHTLTEMLVEVVEQEVHQARVPGYRVAGKTGTAEIPVPGGYDEQETIASFVGYGPADDPQLIILVKLDRPQTSRFGGDTAAVVFSRLASQLFPMLGVQPVE